ncbi:MAG: hypothetical protein IT440_03750 [Phycisphaeraceae bacterium]|nr:hypothetical protein [Phycisphaeraceae bacterium]
MAMQPLTLQLSDHVAAELASVSRETGRGPEAVAEELLRRMILLRRFEKLRREVREAMGPDAPMSEDDIFAQIT